MRGSRQRLKRVPEQRLAQPFGTDDACCGNRTIRNLIMIGRIGLLAVTVCAGIVLLTELARSQDHVPESGSSCRPGLFRRVGHTACRIPPYDPQPLVEEAAGSIMRAKNHQVRNGEILDRTLWNHHFAPKGGQLQPSGMAMLNRLARTQGQAWPVEVFVATAHDLPYDKPDPETFAAARDQLDAARARVVTDYLRIVLRRDKVRVLLHDPAPVGMVAEESAVAYRRGLQGATSLIPPRESIGDFGLGGSGLFGTTGGALGEIGGGLGGFGSLGVGLGGGLGGLGWPRVGLFPSTFGAPALSGGSLGSGVLGGGVLGGATPNLPGTPTDVLPALPPVNPVTPP